MKSLLGIALSGLCCGALGFWSGSEDEETKQEYVKTSD
jgi:hypothetical protein